MYIHSQTQQCIFFALLAASFGHDGRHQANILQKLEKFQKGWLHILTYLLHGAESFLRS